MIDSSEGKTSRQAASSASEGPRPSPAERLAARRALLGRMARPARGEPLKVFCSGIGGVGLSGLARLLAALGHRVQGSDRAGSLVTEALEARGIEVVTTQQAENLGDEIDLFVATAALPPTHPELVAAIERQIPVVKYAEALGALVAARRGVAVAGTHGKTTTTALLAYLLTTCGRSPSYVVGGNPKNLAANASLGEGSDLIFEACEFDRSFRHYQPTIATLLNVEADHLDCYRDGLDEIVDAFVEFGARIREGGALIVMADCPGALRVADKIAEVRPDVSLDTVSLRGPARYEARELTHERGLARFDLWVDGAFVAPVRLSLPGSHNAGNALVAIAAAARAGVEPAQAAAAVEGYTGVRRRFDVLAEGDVAVVDDYAHHPTAIEVVLDAARRRYPDRRIVVCFEPHQASRTRHLFDDFAQALAGADRVLLADIYLCRDQAEDAAAVTSAELAAAVRALAPSNEARHAGDLAALALAAREVAQAGDLLLCLGAGRITQVAHELAKGFTPPRRPPGKPRRAPGRLDAALRRELGDALRQDAPLGPHCTLRTGGVSRFLVAPRSLEEAVAAQRAFLRHGVPVVPLGGGSNTLFCSERLDAAVLLTRQMRWARVTGDRLRASCGASLVGALRLAEKHGLAGLERFAAIPGTLGGAVFGNAGGARDAGTVGDRVRRARVVEPDGAVRWRTREELGLRYRGSNLAGCLVLELELELTPDDPARLREVRRQATFRKAESQPLGAHSAGCTFSNPAGHSAGRLIDELGLKGLRVGGAVVSAHHANFIVNEGQATPQDVVGLVEEVRRRVRAARGIELQTELRLIA